MALECPPSAAIDTKEWDTRDKFERLAFLEIITRRTLPFERIVCTGKGSPFDCPVFAFVLLNCFS